MSIIERFREERDAILNEWEAEVRRSASQSASFSRDDLRDDMPAFLDRLAAWLESGSTRTGDAVDKETIGKHAMHRLQHSVELPHLIHEYRLLRQVILRHVTQRGETEELKGLFPRLSDALDHAITETVATYATSREQARELVLAVLGHDLRSPLMAISMSAAALLRSGQLNPRQVDAVSRIEGSADRATRMIADLLDVARSRFGGGGSMPLRREWTDLAEVAQSTTGEWQSANPGRAVEFQRREKVIGCWDRDRVAQVVSNLVGNAIQHGLDPVIASVVEDGDCAEIRVSNHGARIPEAIIPSLFEPYRRASEAGNGGLGLGLFIVAEIVRAHAGTISVDSDDERTIFTVRLPKRPPGVDQLDSAPPSPSP